MWARTFSAEAISSALAPRTQTWYRDEGRKIPAEDAAMALSGVEPIARAFLLVSWGHDSPEDVATCTRYLMGCAAWEAESDRWREGRLERLVELCLKELAEGYEAGADEEFKDARRAREMGFSRQAWGQGKWKRRYARLMRDALEQVSRAHQAMARRVVG